MEVENSKGIVDDTAKDPEINPREEVEAIELETYELTENSAKNKVTMINTKDFSGSYQRVTMLKSA